MFAVSPSLDSAEGRAAANGAAALIAAFAGPSANGRETIARSEAAASLNTIRQFIEANLHKVDLGPDFICRHLGISRAKLYRVFEPMDGVSHYVLQRRLTLARQMIADPASGHHRISAIAARCGFGNVSVFSRAFRQAYGMSPTEFLRAIERDELTDVRLSGEAGFGTIGRWLLGLDMVGS
jgi:AraC-like DNA-binding protein